MNYLGILNRTKYISILTHKKIQNYFPLWYYDNAERIDVLYNVFKLDY